MPPAVLTLPHIVAVLQLELKQTWNCRVGLDIVGRITGLMQLEDLHRVAISLQERPPPIQLQV